MDKRTLLAVVLSVVVISVGFMLQSLIFPKPSEETAIPTDADALQEQRLQVTEGAGSTGSDSGTQSVTTQPSTTTEIIPTGDVDDRERTVSLETELLKVVFSNRGGEIVSLQLKKHDDKGGPVDMIYRGDSDVGAFFINFGGIQPELSDFILIQQRKSGQKGL